MMRIHNILSIIKPWVIHPSGQQFVYFNYNPVGDNTKVYSSLPNDWERNYTYDLLGRRLTYTEGELAESLTYNGGNLSTHSQSWLENGNTQTKTTTYHYNAHRLDSVSYDDALTTIYHYDQYGRVDSLYDESGVVCYQYGKMGEITKETRIYALPFLSQPISLTTQFRYDSWGRVDSIFYPDGERLKYQYDLGGQLQSITNNSNYTYLDNVTYDRFGAKVSQEYGNGLVTNYSYNNLTRRLSGITTMDGNSQVSSFAYTYDNVGNVTQVTSVCPWLTNRNFTETFTYDASDQLTAATETQHQGYQLAVSYGNWGKITSYSLAQADLQNNTTQSEIQAYTYPVYNSLQDAQTLFAPAQRTITDANNNMATETLSFGINGSLKKREVQAQPQTSYTEYYLFNSAANLKAYSNNGLDFAYYGYNASNTRTYKISMLNANTWVNGQPEPLSLQLQQAMFYPNAYLNFNHNGEYTKHYYNGSERIASRLGDAQPESFVISSNDRLGFRTMQADQQARAELLEVVEAGDVPIETPSVDVTTLQVSGNPDDIFYYHTNHLGSTAFITDNNTNIHQGFLYAPFGEITTEYDINFGYNVLPKYSFNAKELDEETGMYYYEARYYKPPVFTSRDPMYEKYPTFSPYTYCANNPVKYVDPSGRAFDPTQDENYIKPMEDDIKKKIAERTAMRDKCKVGSKKYNRLNEHITELNKALTEISDLRKDENNLYFLTFGDIMFNKDAGGEFADCAGLLTYGGQNNGMTQININIAAKYSGTSSTMLHEFKHAFQYYEGKLGFYIDNYVTPSISSSNSMPLEKEAHFRASVYSFANTKSFNQFIFCINGYEDLDVFLSPSIQHHSIAQRNGKIYINNSKSYDPYKK